MFMNTDTVVHVHRLPVGNDFALRARGSIGPDGIGVTTAEIFDRDGFVGTSRADAPGPAPLSGYCSGVSSCSIVGTSSLTVGWMCIVREIVGVRHLGRHDVEDRVHHLVAADAEDRRAQDLLGLGVDDDLHEALGLALLHRAADPRHRPLAHQRLAARLADLATVMPGPAQRRIDVERVGR